MRAGVRRTNPDSQADEMAGSASGGEEPAESFWSALDRELGEWQSAGMAADFWWRDDDAVAATPELERLLAVSRTAGVALGIAAVPGCLQPSLAPALSGQPQAVLLQHGFAHVNHAPATVRGAWELGPHRPMDEMLAELAAGRWIMEAAFGGQFLAVVTPPWNRFDRRLLPGLRQAGFIGLSAAGERQEAEAGPGFVEANIHFDLLSWKAGPRFRGEASAQSEILGHLRRRRLGTADRAEPTGLLTHHLVLDEPAWRFLTRFLDLTTRHPAARWRSPREIFAGAAARWETGS
jgi:hypothetical protein